MSETKFSQGPWRVDPEGINGWVVCGTKIEEPPEDPFWSARLGTLSLNRGHSEKLRSTAYLIAAAPDLYEALVGVMAEIAFLGDEEHYFGTTERFDAARAALAKARGEA